MIHVLVEFVFVSALSFAVAVTGYTVGRRFEDIRQALRGRLMR